MSNSLNELINYKGVCRTALGTPGQLDIYKSTMMGTFIFSLIILKVFGAEFKKN